MTSRLVLLCALCAEFPLHAAAPAEEGSASSCASLFQTRYADDWGFTQDRWKEACDREADPLEALRSVQEAFIRRCAARFSKLEAEGKLAAGMSRAYCAQGVSGESRLADMTGLKPPPPTELKNTGEMRPPGVENMGPLVTSIGIAKSRWKSDACFSGLYYSYFESDWVEEDEWERARGAGRSPVPTKDFVEQYTYYFTSPGAKVNDYLVVFGDLLDSAFCSHVDRLDGPDGQEEVARVSGLDSCVEGVEVGLSEALKIAERGGLRPHLFLRAYLGVFPTGFFASSACRLAKINGPICRSMPGWDPGKLRRATGKPFWALMSDGKTALVDARKGRLRHIGEGDLYLTGVREPAVRGIPCPLFQKSKWEQ